MISDFLNKLIEFKKISDNFTSIQQKFNKSVENVFNIEIQMKNNLFAIGVNAGNDSNLNNISINTNDTFI